MNIKLLAVMNFIKSLVPVFFKDQPFQPVRAILTILGIVLMCFLMEYFGVPLVQESGDYMIEVMENAESQ